MGIINLQNVKDRHRKYLESELERTDDKIVKVYLKNMIRSINIELDEIKDMYYINDSVTEQLLQIIDLIGLTRFNVVILTALFCNDVIGASKLASQIKTDRSMMYRTLEHLIKIGIVTVIEGKTKQYSLIDKEKPFDIFLEKQIARMQVLKDFQLFNSDLSPTISEKAVNRY